VTETRLTEICRDSIARGSKTFTFASRFFGPEKARDAALLYHWCRNCDDTVDESSGESQRLGLERLKLEVAEALSGKPGDSVPTQALAYLVAKYSIPAHYPNELIEGMAMDAEFRAPRDLQELELYCYRVAGVVGLMMAHILGVSSENALRSACDLGMAMQLTNISRDVIVDHAIGRCYIPEDVLSRHGLSLSNYAEPERRGQLNAAVGELLAAADGYYASGEYGARFLSARSSFVILIARFAYARIGDKIRIFGCGERQITSTREKFLCLIKAAKAWTLQLMRRPRWEPARIQQIWRLPS
jgi:15-cis-phytoene synthase